MSHYTNLALVVHRVIVRVVSYFFAVLVGWLGSRSSVPSGPLPWTVTVFKPVGVA
jgi:hypothetical protein